MSGNIERIGAKIVSHSRQGGANNISAHVRLRYRCTDQGERVISTRVDLLEGTEERWRITKRRILASAWNWLEMYFDGACLDSDWVNIFSVGVFGENIIGAEGGTSELSLEQEEQLQRERQAHPAQLLGASKNCCDLAAGMALLPPKRGTVGKQATANRTSRIAVWAGNLQNSATQK